MLIVLTGSEGIGKRQLARAIISQFTDFQIDGFTIKFMHDLSGNVITSIYNDDELLLAQGEGSPEVGENHEYYDILVKANEIYFDSFLDNVKVHHMFNTHVDIDYDLNLIDEHNEFNDSDMLHSVDVVELYNNKTTSNLVISGLFSKYYFDMLRTELGDDNVKVINITRNPSVSYLLDYKEGEFYNGDTKPDLNEDVNKQKFMESLICTGKLADASYVTNIKFEDILVNGLTIMGKEIELPPGYAAYNTYITIYENENHTVQDLTEVNSKMVEFDPAWWDSSWADPYLDPTEDHGEHEAREEYTVLIKKAVPDIFDLYNDYSPLDYDTIVSSRS